MVTGLVAFDGHKFVELVNVNVALPGLTPITTPAFETTATNGLELIQVPPVVGDNVVVNPLQIDDAPVILTVGFGWTTIP